MRIDKVLEITKGKIITKADYQHVNIFHGLSSDLMSDVLTLHSDNTLLVTGLANNQTIRTAEMLDIHCIIFARNKHATPDMIALAEQSNIVLIETPYSMFKVVGLLFQNGIQPLY